MLAAVGLLESKDREGEGRKKKKYSLSEVPVQGEVLQDFKDCDSTYSLPRRISQWMIAGSEWGDGDHLPDKDHVALFRR
ncbi:hypothetical protein CDAR_177411 [Caerostris darwini]|uniref:Uncharacterized protein n=1 Tax=Caerostris darwini TaxID=1538125 RepID=A0AAV4P1M8_9ARAC|nr:hypothetical protein CDAR_177411 [Caerostris darwini]